MKTNIPWFLKPSAKQVPVDFSLSKKEREYLLKLKIEDPSESILILSENRNLQKD